MESLNQILTQIIAAQDQYARQSQAVTLVAVSKRRSLAAIRDLYAAGQRHFGENTVQEAIKKIAELNDCAITWHFIGTVQSNKTKSLAEHFDWVQSVTTLKQAQRLDAQRPADKPPLNICLQVNIDQDPNKSGIAADQALVLASAIQKLPRLKLRGLMAILAQHDDPLQNRKSFAQMRKLFEHCQQAGLSMDTLSMGMSGDFKDAIAEGSTMVRIGTALFE